MSRAFARSVSLGFLICWGAWLPVVRAGDATGGARLASVRRIWDRGAHNAFTDLIHFRDRWFCVFREGRAHVSPDGALRVITSRDGKLWESAARIRSETADLRDAKITVTPGGRLTLIGAAAFHDPRPIRHQTLAWFSDDGRRWSEAVEVGDPDLWLWRATWHRGSAYGIGYSTVGRRFVRLYRSRDGREFETLVDDLGISDYPNETSIVFRGDSTAFCLLRRDPENGLLGLARTPYTRWIWKDVGVRIGGPRMIELPGGRLLAAVRLYDGRTRTSLCWIDAGTGKLSEFLELPSAGDTSYAGLVWQEDVLWISYYSSHEKKTSIYLARVRFDPPLADKADGSPRRDGKRPPTPPGDSSGKEKVDPDADYRDELPRLAPREPGDSLQALTVLPGFRVELVAAEPLVVDPISLSYDERGRMFVVCMRGYSENAGDHLGQVRLLEDINGDGRFDRSSVYVDKLSWPTGVICYDGGVFVAVAPDVRYYKDTDGDGVADFRKVLYTGFGRSNVQGLVNSLRWGLDNRIHGATSSAGGSVRRIDAPGDAREIPLRGRDFAFDPRTGELAATSGGGQHGLSFDNWGRKFVSSNSSHLEMVMFEERYARRNRSLPVPSARRLIAADGGQAEVFRQSPVEPWRIVRTRLRVAGTVPGPVEGGGRAAGYFTGATGVTIYRGDAWPEEFHGQAFIGDVGSNIVHRKKLEPRGVGFVGERVDRGREFLASEEVWFRPVQFANAPDGTLHVIDMYREVIEHPKSLPPMIKKHLDLNSGRDRGRIYRIVPEDFRPRPPPRLDRATTEELVATLEHRNGWHRETAARLLYQRQDLRAAEGLEAMARESEYPLGRLHALYALDGLGGVTAELILQALQDLHGRVREHAVRLAERVAGDSAAVREALYRMVGDEDDRVRYQLAFTLGEFSGEGRHAALARIARRDGGDPWIRLAVLSSVAEGGGEVLSRLSADNAFRRSGAGRQMLGALASMIGAQNQRDATAETLRSLEALFREDPEVAAFLVRELGRGLERSGSPLRELLASRAGAAGEILEGLLEDARRIAVDGGRKPAERCEAARTLALGSFARGGEILARLLDSREPRSVQIAALAALSRFADAGVAGAVLKAWPGFSPRVRERAVDVLLARPERTRQLLDAVDDDRVRPTDLGPSRIRWLRSHRDRPIRERAGTVLADVKLRRRQDVVESYRGVLKLEGVPERGKAIFKNNCATCHQVEGVGNEIGPSLLAMHNRGAEAMLLAVLDPNREVNPQYLEYLIVSRTGRLITGLISAETATSVTLRRGDEQTDTVLRTEIESLSSSGLSIMPEGLEKEIDRQGMADLIAYLLHARAQPAEEWKAGVARMNITPREQLWMSGYASRDRPAEGKLTDLWAKALVLEDPAGERAVLVTLDLIGVNRELTLRIRRRLEEAHGLDLARVALCSSHTHTGPVVGRNLSSMYFVSDEQVARIDRYALRLERDLLDVVGRAVKDLRPAGLSWGIGRATFAVNRRENREADVPRLRAAGGLRGPVDHDVPVLAVTTPGGELTAVVTGYACHATVLSFQRWSGDYAGFAQIELEKSHPGAVAMFWAGCGGDQNPLPRRKVDLAREYGRQLARAVDEVLGGDMQRITGRLAAAYTEVDLPFAGLPSRREVEQKSQSSNRYEASRARLLLERLERDGTLSPTYPYPVQSWRLGPDLLFITLGGEVVVDYSLRLKEELGRDRTWVAAYANDVMAYIPSLRVLKEGGYEGGGSMVYYGLPALWSERVEELIVSTVHEQTKRLRSAPR